MQKIKYKYIPNCLRKYRRARGLNQKEIALILGLKSTGMISRWENGVCLPDTINVFRLAIIYRSLIDALFSDIMRALKAELLEREREVLKDRHE